MSILVLGLSACTVKCTTQEANSAELERNLANTFRGDGIPVDTVKCKNGVGVVGEVIPCIVTIAGKPYDLEMTIEKIENGRAITMPTWKHDEPISAKKATAFLDESLSKAVGSPATTDCGEPVLVPDAAHRFRCKVQIGELATHTVVTMEGTTFKSWRFDPPAIARTSLEKAITADATQQLERDVKVVCGTAAVLSPTDGKLVCELSDGADRHTIDVTTELVSGSLTVTHWKVRN